MTKQQIEKKYKVKLEREMNPYMSGRYFWSVKDEDGRELERCATLAIVEEELQKLSGNVRKGVVQMQKENKKPIFPTFMKSSPLIVMDVYGETIKELEKMGYETKKYSLDDIISQHGTFEQFIGQLEMGENMAKRTPENCSLIQRLGQPGKDGNGKCMGFVHGSLDDEPWEECQRCKYCASYQDE